MKKVEDLLDKNHETGEVILKSPTAMPHASAFLWNPRMMVQVNCRGFVVAQHMQPEPAKYAFPPNIEAKTFMQPEQTFYTHHPGRFIYIKDEETKELVSVPYEPCRRLPDRFEFRASPMHIAWEVECLDLVVELQLGLACEQPIEIWDLKISSKSPKMRKLSIYTYFSIGYMSWMNQSGMFDGELNGVVASCVSPYQMRTDYYKQRDFKDMTYLIADIVPDAYESRQEAFEGEGGLSAPSAVHRELLGNSEAVYEIPAAVLQYRRSISPEEKQSYRFLFGPAKDRSEIKDIRSKYLFGEVDEDASPQTSNKTSVEDCVGPWNHEKSSRYIELAQAMPSMHQRTQEKYRDVFWMETPDKDLDHFVNFWLGRQVYYHGDVHRLTTDPQTRNYLQDTMGMSYIDAPRAKKALLLALSQQLRTGAMPEGILLHRSSEFKYINRIPHMDHCVWLPICVEVYVEETNDYGILEERVAFGDEEDKASVAEHVHRAMYWLLKNRDHRGLSYIAEGDWCDPMNMVGPKGVGVSGWLSLATAYALQIWAKICEKQGYVGALKIFKHGADECVTSVNRYLWDGDWYARGITDDGVTFGTRKDPEGKIFLNPQAWALLAQAASREQQERMISSVEAYLESPHGVALLGPAFTRMREDIGRLTQKHPGTAENGSVYNHASAFYSFGLYQIGEDQRAFSVLRRMLPGPDMNDYIQREQLPVFIPNYYRGCYREHPRTAGRSSQLCHTGTVHWLYRCLISGLMGMRGTSDGLHIEPHFPREWDDVLVKRVFRGASFSVRYLRSKDRESTGLVVNGKAQKSTLVSDIQAGAEYVVEVRYL